MDAAPAGETTAVLRPPPAARAPARASLLAGPPRRWLRQIALLLILLAAVVVRFYDLNWDQSQYNHPDERHVTNVISSLSLPDSLADYFNSGTSPLNPYNIRQSWVYGTLPLFTTRIASEWLDTGCAPEKQAVAGLVGRMLFGREAINCNAGFFTGYEYIRLVGRSLSALADVITVLVVFLTGRRLFGWRVGLLAAFLSTFTVLQIQHSKFFVVESLLTLCTATCLYFCARISTFQIKGPKDAVLLWVNAIFAGLMCGLAVACKISVWPTAVIALICVSIALVRDRRANFSAIFDALIAAVIVGVMAFAGFRVAQPYGFVNNSEIEWQYTTQNCLTGLTREQQEICLQIAPMPDTVTKLVGRLPEFARPILAPSSRWVSELQSAASMASGVQDPPFGWQWANRMPIVFPLINIVFYGLGVPLGIAAVIGTLFMLWQALRGRRTYAYLVPALWIIGFFLYQSTQFVKSIRYQLPIYPMLCVAAAAVLIALWRRIGMRRIGMPRIGMPRIGMPRIGMPRIGMRHIRTTNLLKRAAALAPVVLVAGGTLAWALAFMNIYRHELTRTEASRWIFNNVPTALTLSGDLNGQPRDIPLPVMSVAALPNLPFNAAIRLSEENDGVDGPIKDLRFTFNHLIGQGQVQADLIDTSTQERLQSVQQNINAGQSSLVFDAAELSPGKDYMLSLTLLGGEGIQARTSVIANQHWDEGVPFRMDGKDGFDSYYRGLTSGGGEMQVYAEEDPYIDENNPGKLETLLRGMDEADYLILNSNRHYASVARLPWRFPLTNAYYDALMGGRLGFELVADFARFPQLGPFIFNDQEMPQTLVHPATTQGTPLGIQVPYPPAEEAFSVYDHPRVLIYKKTANFSRQQAEQLLSPYFDPARVLKDTAFKVSNAPHGLLMSKSLAEAQAAGGTWADLFPRNSPLNQSPIVASLAWLLLFELLGLAAFPLIALASRKKSNIGQASDSTRSSGFLFTLADGGYAFAKTLGLLLIAVGSWWLGSLRLVEVTPITLWVCVAVLVALGAHLWFHQRATIFSLIKARWKLMVAGEVIFLLAFGIWLLVRAGNPDLWHPYRGGEKPMDFAYLNAVLKSTYFPPFDPWFAGGYINYYYFGFVVIGWPIKALGIDPAVAYNLAVPMLFALTAMGAYGLGVTMYGAIGRSRTDDGRRMEDGRWLSGVEAAVGRPPSIVSAFPFKRTILAGFAAAIFVVGIGNGDEIRVVGPAMQRLGGLQQGETPVIAFANGFGKWLSGEELPGYPDWPYWNPTRPTAGRVDADGKPLPDSVQIAEFPQFTFLYADLHAHMMAMPLALLAVAFALAFAAGARKWYAIALGAMVAGALWPTNTWDYYPYLLLGIGGLLLPVFASDDPPVSVVDWIAAAVKGIPAAIVFFALSRAFFIPYLENFGSAYNSVIPWTDDKTPLNTYITIYATFMIPLAIYALLQLRKSISGDRPLLTQLPVLILAGGALATAFLLTRDAPIAIFAMPMLTLALAASATRQANNTNRLMWFAAAGGFAITIFVELFTLEGDLGRMNTVFKFYILAWLLLGTSAAAATMGVLDELFGADKQLGSAAATADDQGNVVHRPSSVVLLLRPLFSIAMAIALFLAALYPAFAIPAKIRDRYVRDIPAGLDGMAYMQVAERGEGSEEQEGRSHAFPLKWDYEAIKWMQDNVKGSPNIIEEGSARGNQYRWSGRFSIYTGLPTLVGWQWHQRQQRAAMDDRVVFERDDDVATFYRTPDPEQARLLLRRYQVKYIINGDMERIYHTPAGQAKFQSLLTDGTIRIAYQNEGTTIYEVLR